jgi:putative membrane protein
LAGGRAAFTQDFAASRDKTHGGAQVTAFSIPWNALMASAHHLAAFALVASLVAEFALLRAPLTLQSARHLRLADMAYGIAAGLVLVVGFFRVFYFEKGAAYYFHSAPFIAKVWIFLAVGLVSIYPTVQFISWGKALKAGATPVVAESKLRLMRIIVNWELTGLALMILCAALMAKGVGTFG